MSSLFLGQILTSAIAGESETGRAPASAAPDVRLEPLEPGVWAAWARAAREQAAGKAGSLPGTRPVKVRHDRLAQGLHR